MSEFNLKVMSDSRDDTPLVRWNDYVTERLHATLEQSAISIVLFPAGGRYDAKLAVELGMSILLEKPIIILAQPGSQVPSALVSIAHAVVTGTLEDESTRVELLVAIEEAGPV